MNFQVGDKVLCINDKNWKFPITNTPECGELYTIREIFKAVNDRGELGFLLEEITNHLRLDSLGGLSEPGFAAYRFTKFDPEDIEAEYEEEILELQIEKLLDTIEGREKIEELLEI